jgi:hypothetical protein
LDEVLDYSKLRGENELFDDVKKALVKPFSISTTEILKASQVFERNQKLSMQ